MKCPFETSIYLSISTSDPGTKYETSGVMWQVALESKIQLVSYELSPKYILGVSTLEDIRAIDAYIFWDLFCSKFLSYALYIYFYLYVQVFGLYVFQKTLFSIFPGPGKSVIQWSSDPHLKHLFGFILLCSVHLLLGLRELKYELNFLFPFPFLCCLKKISVGCDPPQWLHFELENCSLCSSYWIIQIQLINF